MKKTLYLLLALTIGAIGGAVLEEHFLRETYEVGIKYLEESELKYNATKSELADSVNSYISKVAPSSNLSSVILVDLCEEYKVNITFVLAQAEIESHFGTKGLASKTNSVWNYGAFDNVPYRLINKIYKYRNPNESIEPYLQLLTSRYLVKEAEEGLLHKFVDINGNRYATDIHYEERLQNKYNLIQQTTKIDSLQKVMNYWAIKSNRYNYN